MPGRKIKTEHFTLFVRKEDTGSVLIDKGNEVTTDFSFEGQWDKTTCFFESAFICKSENQL
jgi:hypothetical protein